jgi:peptidoglycan/LPS O-acetylase OafA/YrhL
MRPLHAKKDAHIGALDGLRAVAILLVLLYHLTPGHDPNQGLRSLLYKIAQIGWSGVDLFFVLSGFLITTKLLEARDEEHRFRNFYARRALRIFPLYYLALIVVFLVTPVAFSRQLPFWLYYSNFVREPALPHLGHFWSLAIEEQFYLVWPAIVFLTSARVARRICVAVILLAPLLRFALATNGFGYITTYQWTPSRADALAMGALIAFAYAHERWRPWLRRASTIAIVLAAPMPLWAMWRDQAALALKDYAHPLAIFVRTLLPTSLALFYASLLILALEVRPLGRILTGRAQTLLARYSYGTYVWHFLFLLPLQRVLGPIHPMLFFTIASAVSIATAVLSYHAFEMFFLRWKSRV